MYKNICMYIYGRGIVSSSRVGTRRCAQQNNNPNASEIRSVCTRRKQVVVTTIIMI